MHTVKAHLFLYTLQVPICGIIVLFVTPHTHSSLLRHLSSNRISLSSLSSFQHPLQMSRYMDRITSPSILFAPAHCRTCGRHFVLCFTIPTAIISAHGTATVHPLALISCILLFSTFMNSTTNRPQIIYYLINIPLNPPMCLPNGWSCSHGS